MGCVSDRLRILHIKVLGRPRRGRVGGPHNFHTYILLANPQTTAADVTVTYLRESGALLMVKTYTVPPTSRFKYRHEQRHGTI
jgi:hypothetical protein